MSDTTFEPSAHDPGAGCDDTRRDDAASLASARKLNLLGLVTPVANLGMIRTAPRDVRWFGVGAGVVLLALAAWAWHRGHAAVAVVALAAHAALVLAGLVNPRFPELPGRAWIRFGLLLGHVMSYPIFALLYWLAVTPMALLVRLFGSDPLRRRAPPAESYWIVREPAPKERFERQF